MSVSEFYSDKVLLVTGGSGFMGKVLLAKLLRSCPSVRRIYVLVRPKRGRPVTQRFRELLASDAFIELRGCDDRQLSKLTAVSADLMQPSLGLCEDDRSRLVNEVNVIFHTAATVKFDEALHVSLDMNVRGTESLLTLAKLMSKLQVFVHVSTAFSNCDRSFIDEQVYPVGVDPYCVLATADCLGPQILETITPRLLGSHPNTYTFTKALAERLVYKRRHELPLVIVRPSIVCCGAQEPSAGWVDNFNGPTGLMVGIGKGLTKTILARSEMVADLVPVDMTVNLVICAAWHRGEGLASCQDPGQVLVYNFVSAPSNPIVWGEFERLWLEKLQERPLGSVGNTLTSSFTSSPCLNNIKTIAHHLLPAAIIDICLVLSGRRSCMIGIQQRMFKTMKCLSFFTSNQWTFRAEHMNQLFDCMSARDRETFKFKVSEIDWKHYICAYREGIECLLRRQGDDKRHSLMKFVTTINRWISMVFLLLILWPFLARRSIISRLLAVFQKCLAVIRHVIIR